MQFDPKETDHSAIYKLLTGAIIPRPIGWISSISEDGINNLAPFSYFNAVGDDPPHVMFSTGISNATFKDTGVTPLASVIVKPMRVKESPITFECELVHHYFLEDHKKGGACIIVGRIVMMHFDDNLLLDNYTINLDIYKPVSRLAGANYAKIGELFTIKRN